MTTHDLKVWPPFFDALADGSKTFELRRDDRGFAVGDTLHLREWNPETREYSGLSITRSVTYVLRDGGMLPGLCRGYVVLGLEPYNPVRELEAKAEGQREGEARATAAAVAMLRTFGTFDLIIDGEVVIPDVGEEPYLGLADAIERGEHLSGHPNALADMLAAAEARGREEGAGNWKCCQAQLDEWRIWAHRRVTAETDDGLRGRIVAEVERRDAELAQLAASQAECAELREDAERLQQASACMRKTAAEAVAAAHENALRLTDECERLREALQCVATMIVSPIDTEAVRFAYEHIWYVLEGAVPSPEAPEAENVAVARKLFAEAAELFSKIARAERLKVADELAPLAKGARDAVVHNVDPDHAMWTPIADAFDALDLHIESLRAGQPLAEPTGGTEPNPEPQASIWDLAEKAQAEVDKWPEWKRRAADTALVTRVDREPEGGDHD